MTDPDRTHPDDLPDLDRVLPPRPPGRITVAELVDRVAGAAGADPLDRARLLALGQLLGATSATSLGFEQVSAGPGAPLVWVGMASWSTGDRAPARWEAGAAVAPVDAVERLAASSLNGSQCPSCHRPSVLSGAPRSAGRPPEYAAAVCVISYLPESGVYREACRRGGPDD